MRDGMESFESIVSRFSGVKRKGSGDVQCLCPCHKDKEASLSIKDAGDKILFHCFGNCKTEDIIFSVGLSWADIGEKEVPDKKWRSRIEYGIKKQHGDGAHIHDLYHYTDENKKYLYTKIRFSGGSIKGKIIRFYYIDNDKDVYTTASRHYGKPIYEADGSPKLDTYGRQEHENGKIPNTLYNLPRLLQAIQEGYPVYITEGEKDVETLRQLGWVATTSGGTSTWKKEFAQYFKGARVVILPDNDPPGREFAERIRRDVSEFAWSVKVVPTSEQEKGDVSDYLKEEGHNKNTLTQLIQNVPYTLASWVSTREDKDGNVTATGIIPDMLAHVVSKYIHFLIVRNPLDDKDSYFIYRDGVYCNANRNQMKYVIRQFIPCGYAKNSQINETLELVLCSDSENVCGIEQLDNKENLINIKNGLLDVRTGELLPHDPEYKSTMQLNVVYDPEAKNLTSFSRFIKDLSKDISGAVDMDKIKTLQEFAGLTLSNVKGWRGKKMLVLHSRLGNSGKSQFLNLIRNILGNDRVANIALQNMNENQRFSLSQLIGKRAIICGDQTASTVEDSSVFKQLLGADGVRIEPKGKTPFTIDFNGTVLIGCNDLPVFKDDKGGHMFERFLIVPCVHTLKPEERDPEILDKMLLEKSAFFNWAFEGLQRLLKNNYRFSISEASKNVTEEYRQNMDTLYRFIENSDYQITNEYSDFVKKKDFEEDYFKYCSENGIEAEHRLTKRSIVSRMESYGCARAKGSGTYKNYEIYRGIKQISGFASSGDEEVPF